MTKEPVENVQKTTGVSLPADLAETLDELAGQWGTTRGELVGEACRVYAALLRGGLRLTDQSRSQGAPPPRVTPDADTGAVAQEQPGQEAADFTQTRIPQTEGNSRESGDAERAGKGVRG